jgi:O-antigen ligase
MPKAIKKQTRKPTASVTAARSQGWQWLTQAAFFLSLVLVIARMAMQEVIRNGSLPTPGGGAAPAVPGPATSLGLDLLCILPALLVLTRRVLEGDYVLRLSWSHLAMGLLALWTLLSIAWSSDKYSALVQAANWSAALGLLWAASQLVHSWLRLRLVAAAALGLLLVLLVQGYYYRFVDLPDLQTNWQTNHAKLLRERGTDAQTAEAHQLEQNILHGVPMGFSVSRNTYAAVLVLLMIIGGGIILQRLRDGDHWGWTVPVGFIIALGLLMLYAFVQSKTAFATPVIGALLFWLLWSKQPWSAPRARRVYWIGLGAFVLAVAAVVGHGLKHGTLVHISLTFRWWYWVGAVRLFLHHPLLGVGWGNFGSHYLAYRLPQAAEDPADPHNFLVRALVELGIVGGILTIAWMLRLWWEVTVKQITAEANTVKSEPEEVYSAFPIVIGIAIAAIAVNAIVSIDFSAEWAWVVLELFKRLAFLLALLAGMCVISIRSFAGQELDDRPAPLLLGALLIAIALFLLHNLIDFSMFESGPMFLFALLTGSALGLRLSKGRSAVRGRAIALATLSVSFIAWLVAAGAVWLPIAEASSLSDDADKLILASASSDAPPTAPLNAAKLQRAANQLQDASRLVPYNADYPFRAEQALLMARSNPDALFPLLDRAIADDPATVRYRLARASLEVMLGKLELARTDFERILQLDPYDLEIRLEYGHVLEKLGLRQEARGQYLKTLELNDYLAPDEIRRLRPEQVEQVQKWIAAMGPQTSTGR